jgi:predicted RNA-binding Zn-ribbon protein involved in translation (DUF1610 family)
MSLGSVIPAEGIPISCAYYIKERSDDSLSISSTELENGVIASAYGLSYEEVIRGLNRLMEEYFQQITCIACGAPLDAVTRGRHKFCAKCGVYLPRIIYDKSA